MNNGILRINERKVIITIVATDTSNLSFGNPYKLK